MKCPASLWGQSVHSAGLNAHLKSHIHRFDHNNFSTRKHKWKGGVLPESMLSVRMYAFDVWDSTEWETTEQSSQDSTRANQDWPKILDLPTTAYKKKSKLFISHQHASQIRKPITKQNKIKIRRGNAQSTGIQNGKIQQNMSNSP